MDSAGPRYVVAFVVCSCCSFIAVATAYVLRNMLVQLNRKLEKDELVRDVRGDSGDDVVVQASGRGFRYLL